MGSVPMNGSASPPLVSAPSLLAIPRSAVAFVLDLEDARRLAHELECSASAAELEQQAADIFAGRVLVVRREAPLALDPASPERAPLLCSLMEAR